MVQARPVGPAEAGVIFIQGPTAAGKTELAISMAAKFPVEIVSVDSSLVYRRMDIGTGKPSAEELEQAPHRLIDIREPWQTYSAAEFCSDARQQIDTVHAAGKIPLLVGGTMMYFDALQYGLSELPEADERIRQQLRDEGEKLGWPAMHERLRIIDPDLAARIDPNDPQRIQRGLEIYAITGERPTEIMRKSRGEKLPFNVTRIIVNPEERAWLHERIEKRFHAMLKKGLVEEVENLLQEPQISPELPAMRMVGYRQVIQYLRGDFDLDELSRRGVYATRQLAKRQITWLRRYQNSIHVAQPDQSNWLDNILHAVSRAM